jgi:hypothetical protein
VDRKIYKHQRIARRWIPVVDLIDWCAQSATTVSLEPEANARQFAYQRFTDSVRKGEFEREGPSKIPLS